MTISFRSALNSAQESLLRDSETYRHLGFGPKGFYDDVTSRFGFIVFCGGVVSTGQSCCPKKRCSQRRLRVASRSTFHLSQCQYFASVRILANAWIANTKFSGVTGESDPLLGNRESIPGCPVTGNFTVPGDGTLRGRVSGLPQFVTVRGGAYFFLQACARYAISPEFERLAVADHRTKHEKRLCARQFSGSFVPVWHPTAGWVV